MKDHSFNHSFKDFLRPANLNCVVSKNGKIFIPLLTLLVFSRFILIVASLNFYSDVDRFTICGGKTTSEESAAVFDTAIQLYAIHHIIEYCRILILWAVATVGASLAILYYILSPNVLLGFVAFIVTAISRFGGAGGECASVQKNRGTYLIVEFILFFLTFWLYSFPFIFIKFIDPYERELALVDAEIVSETIDKYKEDETEIEECFFHN